MVKFEHIFSIHEYTYTDLVMASPLLNTWNEEEAETAVGSNGLWQEMERKLKFSTNELRKNWKLYKDKHWTVY